MRLFRPTYRDKTGEKRELKKWWVELRDHQGIVRRFPAFTDQEPSKTLGKQIERLVACRISGDSPGPELSRWLEQTTSKLRERLASIGLLDRTRAAGGKPLVKEIKDPSTSKLQLVDCHLADFRQALGDRGNTAAQVVLTISRVKRIVEGCKFRTWSDISANTVSRYLADLQAVDGISTKTKNYYLKAIKHFCRWMVKQRRASESPLEHVDCTPVRADDIWHERRGLSADEVRRLLETTTTQPERFGMAGTERALLYRLAVETGLRANEVRNLMVGSFDFERCTVTVESKHTKNRRQAILPLRQDTAVALKQFLAGRLPSVKAFGGAYKRLTDKTALLIQADLQAAGIGYVDESGRYADFHSLRHTTGTLLAASGVHPKVAQSIMRHSDINLTMSRYTHTLTGQEGQAVESLPDLSLPSIEQQKAVKTGTDNLDVLTPQQKNLAENLAFQDAQPCNSVQRGAKSTATNGSKNADLTGPGRIRTYDQWIMSPLLYR